MGSVAISAAMKHRAGAFCCRILGVLVGLSASSLEAGNCAVLAGGYQIDGTARVLVRTEAGSAWLSPGHVWGSLRLVSVADDLRSAVVECDGERRTIGMVRPDRTGIELAQARLRHISRDLPPDALPEESVSSTSAEPAGDQVRTISPEPKILLEAEFAVEEFEFLEIPAVEFETSEEAGFTSSGMDDLSLDDSLVLHALIEWTMEGVLNGFGEPAQDGQWPVSQILDYATVQAERGNLVLWEEGDVGWVNRFQVVFWPMKPARHRVSNALFLLPWAPEDAYALFAESFEAFNGFASEAAPQPPPRSEFPAALSDRVED